MNSIDESVMLPTNDIMNHCDQKSKYIKVTPQIFRRKVMVTMFVVFCTFSNMVYGQESVGTFLLRDSRVKLSTFYFEINPSTSFSVLNDQVINVTEFSGGFIMNNRFYLSFFTTGSPKINTVRIPEPGTQEYDDWIEAGVEVEKISSQAEFLFVKFKHSGLKFGYLHHTEHTVFWRAGILLGFTGGLNMTEDQTFLGLFDNLVFETNIFTLEPHFGGAVNLLLWWRVHLDLGYRLLAVDKRILEATETDSFTLKLGFSFGNFRYK